MYLISSDSKSKKSHLSVLRAPFWRFGGRHRANLAIWRAPRRQFWRFLAILQVAQQNFGDFCLKMILNISTTYYTINEIGNRHSFKWQKQKNIFHNKRKLKHKKFRNWSGGNRSARRKPTSQLSNFKSTKCTSNVWVKVLHSLIDMPSTFVLRNIYQTQTQPIWHAFVSQV